LKVRYHADGQIYAMKVLGKEHIKLRNEVPSFFQKMSKSGQISVPLHFLPPF
jgi:hypothetical protein